MFNRSVRNLVLLTGFACCASISTPAFAVEPHAELKLMRVGNMQYLSGGVSNTERTVLDHRAADFHVRVDFVGKTGKERVREVFVTIVERKEGNCVIRFKTAGPVLLMSLPAGSYTLSATTVRGTEAVQSQLELEPGKKEGLRVVLGDEPTRTPRTATASASSNRL
jgi:hypothetical protein